MVQQAWTTAEIEAFEAIELPTREAFTGLCGGLITVDLDVNIDVDADVSVGSGDCSTDSGGSSGGGSNGGGSNGGGSCK